MICCKLHGITAVKLQYILSEIYVSLYENASCEFFRPSRFFYGMAISQIIAVKVFAEEIFHSFINRSRKYFSFSKIKQVSLYRKRTL